MKTAILFLHWGNAQECLHLNLAAIQARLWNPHAKIYVLADAAARESLTLPGVEVVPLEDYHTAAESFRCHYVHFSVNRPAYTRFNIERWFIMRDFVRQHGLQRILHLDSDVLLYDDVEAAGQQFEECDLTLSWPSTSQVPNSSGHSSYFNLHALEEFCAFVEAAYADPATIEAFENRVAGRRANGGVYNIGDMYHLACFSLTTQLKIGYGQQGHPLFDGNINYDFETKARLADGHRPIEYRKGQPHARYASQEKVVRHATLHFQGRAKAWMPENLQAPEGTQLPCDLLFPLMARLSRTTNHNLGESKSAKLDFQKERDEALATAASLQSECESLKERRAEDARNLKVIRQAMAQAEKKVETAARSQWVTRGTQLGLTKAGTHLQSAIDHLQVPQQKQNPDSPPKSTRE